MLKIEKIGAGAGLSSFKSGQRVVGTRLDMG